jgi:fatty acid desaturase
MKILRYRADLRSLVFVFALLALIAIQWSGLLRQPLLYAATLLLSFVACIVNHNHQHCRTFLPDALNRIFSVLLSLAIGQPATAIVPMHNRNHHSHNNSSRDCVRASQVGFRWNLLNLLAFPFLAVRRYALAKSREMRNWRKSEPALYRQLRLERWIFYPTLILLLVFKPIETLIYIVCPYLFGQWSIIAINLVQHDGCDPRQRLPHRASPRAAPALEPVARATCEGPVASSP